MDWIKKDLQYNWHPYTQMKDCTEFPPILIEKAKGIKLFDENGNFYYDTISSWWCNIHGHSHPLIKKAIKEQLDKVEHVLFAGFTHKPAIQLAEKLVSITPEKLKRIFYSDNGSTAVEIALKMSYQYWQNKGVVNKKKFISLDASYHGDTIGAMSVSGVSLYNDLFSPLYKKHYKIPSPYCYRCPKKQDQSNCSTQCISYLKDLLEKQHENIAAIILEPLLMGAGGMIIYPHQYLKKVRQLTKKYNVHLIVDEVATGFGRTGKMFATEHANIQPDFMCISKGLTSGYLPFAATLTTEEVYKTFYADYHQQKTFYHGHTYTANPLGCVAALASIEIFNKEQTFTHLQSIIPYFHKKIQIFKDLPLVGDIRTLGMVGALELVKDKTTKEAFGLKERIGMQIFQKGLHKHLILRPLGNIIYFFLPLCTKKKEINYIIENTHTIMKEMKK